MLIVTKRFYPGNKSGGPQTSLLTLCKFIVEKKNTVPYVITFDRDVGDKKPYSIIDSGLVSLGFANVNYVSEQNKIKLITSLIKGFRNNKIIIVNSFFDPVFGVLIPTFFSFFYRRRVYCFVRGELQANSLSFKKQKKKLYMKLFGKLIARNSVFIFSDENELKDSKEAISFNFENYLLVPNLPQTSRTFSKELPEKNGELSLVYLGRIEKDKNLLFLLNILEKIKRPIRLDIYGPIRSKKYWEECLVIIGLLKPLVSVNYKGVLERNGLSKVSGKYHFLVNPSFSENYGHSIAESLGSGLPAIVTMGTPWKELQDHNLGFTVGFDENSWVRLLSEIKINDYHLLYDRMSVKKKFKSYPLVKETNLLNEKFIKNL